MLKVANKLTNNDDYIGLSSFAEVISMKYGSLHIYVKCTSVNQCYFSYDFSVTVSVTVILEQVGVYV